MKCFAKSLLIVLSLGAGALGLGSGSAQAQATPAASQLRLDLAGGFTTIHANEGPGQCGCFFMNGGNGELVVVGGNHLSYVTNVGYTSQTNIGNIGRNLALLTVLEGGRYTLNYGGRLAPFGQASVGFVHTYSNFHIDESTTRVAVAAGGGIDLRVTDRFSVRPAEAEYLLSTVSNGQNNFQNQLRLSAGIVFHLNKSR